MNKKSTNKLKVLVTGGAGFIGSNLVKFLCDKGYNVVVLDDLSSGFRQLVDKRAKFYKGSINNSSLLKKALSGVDTVFYLAATATITFSVKQPEKYFENNFMNGIELLEAMKKAGVKKIIYSSSGAGYGQPKDSYVKEGSPTEPINPYGASKLAFEHVLSAYYSSFGIESVSLRYSNVYGPYDEQKSSTRAISRWIKSAIENIPLTLYWSGKQTRDFVYVDDVVRANVLASEHMKDFQVYNVGFGKGIVMKEIVKKLEGLFNRKLKTVDLGKREGDPHIVVFNISKIKKQLGWKPEVNFDDGLAKMVDYYLNHRIKI